MSPPPPLTSPPPVLAADTPSTAVDSGRTDVVSSELRTLVSNQQQTISLLVNEKASLAAQLGRVEDLQTSASYTDADLLNH